MIAIKSGNDVAHLVIHSAFDELAFASKQACVTINVDRIELPNCLLLRNDIIQRHSICRKFLVKAITLFQAGMEAQIHHWRARYPDIHGGNGFVGKWEKAFTCREIAKDVFIDYASFYRNVRNAVIHPDTTEKFETVNKLTFLDVYHGIKQGWESAEILATALGEPYDNNSWRRMCDSHGVPGNPSEFEYPNFITLRDDLQERIRQDLDRQ